MLTAPESVMSEESETGQTPRIDPPMDSHNPASGKSQDISHVLASMFKDLYTKDVGRETLSNLMKTNKGRSSYHERYVKELEEAHAEYSQCIKEADFLEDHIIQARARAASIESQALERMKQEIGDDALFSDHQDLFPVKSAFSWCVDGDLLKRNNLIAPQDYLTTPKIRMKAPAAVKPDPARPTFAYTMRVSREPQDGSCTLIHNPEKTIPDLNESEFSLTLDSSSCTPNRTETPREKLNKTKVTKLRPKWKDEPSAKDRAEGSKQLQRLKERQNFLRNPRFLPATAQQTDTSLIRSRVLKTKHVRGGMDKQSPNEYAVPDFLAKPAVVVFADYSVGHVYEVTLELKNLTSSGRDVRVIPPTTPYFSIGLGRFPGESGVVAPGLSCKYTVRFAPDSLADYEDFLVVETQAKPLLVVPIEARRPPPVLTLPRVLDCGYCLIGGVKFVEFPCQNIGLSAGTFCVIPKNQWPASNPRSVVRTYFTEQSPFAVSPALFVLQPGEATVVEVVFFPTAAERSRQVFTFVCDNCQVKDISIEGNGQLIALDLVSGETEPPVVGDLHDITAEHFVRFSPCNPHSVQQKKLVIRNNVHLELPFHWQIMKPNQHPLFPGETPELSRIQFHLDSDDVFHVSPETGVLAPCQDHEFLFTFSPKELKDYHSVCHLVLRDVPQPPLDEHCDDGVLQPLLTGSRLRHVIVMEIEVKGSTEPYQVLLEPYAIVIPGDVSIFTTTRRQFKMWNHSRTCVFFQWERMDSIHKIEVEPSTGRIEENECFDFDLMVTGGKPERVVTSLVCHIEHHHEPVTLAVEVSFKVRYVMSEILKGPIVTLSVPSLDFGHMRLGEQSQKPLLLTNITHLEASWTLEEVHNSQQDTQISVEPCRGVLPPLGVCSVDVLFRPNFFHQFETELELTVENGTGCHLLLRADVQSPQVCPLNCELVLPELNVGVPAQDDQSPSVSLLNFGDDVILKKPVVKQLLITNETAIPAPFYIEAEYFTCNDPKPSNQSEKRCAYLKKPLHSVQAKKVEEKAHREFVSSLLAHGKGAAFFVLPNTGMLGPFETQIVDVTAYSDMWGEYRDHLMCRVGNREPTLIPMQMTVKGCPLYFQMTGPRPDDQNQGPIIRFGTHVSGGDTVSRSLRINNPTMFDIRMDWETYNIDPNDRKLVDVLVAYGDAFPVKDADGNEMLSGAIRPFHRTIQTVLGRTDTPGSEGMSASLYRFICSNQPCLDQLKDLERDEYVDGGCEEDKTCLHPCHTKKKLFSVRIRPHVGNPSDYPYCITPQQIVIPAKGSSTIHVSFTPLTLPGPARESRCVGLALGFMSLDSEEASCVVGKVDRVQGLDLEPVRMDLLAVVKHAVLSVQMEEDNGVLEFHASAGDLLKVETDELLREFDVIQTFQLKNTAEGPLRFRLETQPPFLVYKLQPQTQISTSSNPSTGESQSLVLQPQHSMQVKVAFHCSLSLLEHADQADEEVLHGVMLIHSASGQKKLRFQQNLLIHYSNSSLQTVALRAHLDLACLRLSSDDINFGLCYVRQTHTIEVNLCSHGAHTYWKSVIESDEEDSHAFTVTPNFGFLRSKQLHVTSCRQCLQISFTPSEDREFKATVVIQSPLVKTPLTLQLQGTGSFDDKFKSNQM